jgi:hypothetical protein
LITIANKANWLLKKLYFMYRRMGVAVRRENSIDAELFVAIFCVWRCLKIAAITKVLYPILEEKNWKVK